MPNAQLEKLTTLFLAVFSTGLAIQLALDGMSRSQWFGALVAVAGSLVAAAAVRLWPQPEPAPARKR